MSYFYKKDGEIFIPERINPDLAKLALAIVKTCKLSFKLQMKTTSLNNAIKSGKKEQMLDIMQKCLEKNRKIYNQDMSLTGVTVEEIDDSLLLAAKSAWNVLMSAELCNNVSRYEGVKYGYRTKNYTTIDELYTNSRTEAFGELLKTAIIFGSETLSTENYMKV